MEDGFVEHEMKIFSKSIHNMMQAELDRYQSFIQLLNGYYRGIENKPMEELPGPLLCAPNYDSLPECEVKEGEEFKYPLLETIADNCIKILEGKEVLEEGQKSKAAPAKKEAPKKAPPAKKDAGKNKGAKVVEEEAQEKSLFEVEMEKAIEIEKKGTAYRIMLLLSYGRDTLKKMRAFSLEVYEKLDLWTQYAFKIECDLMDELVKAILFRLSSWAMQLNRRENFRSRSS